MPEPPPPKPDAADVYLRPMRSWLASHRDRADLELEELAAQLARLCAAPLPARQTLKVLEMLFAGTALALERQANQLGKARIPLARQARLQFNTLLEVLDDFALAYEGVLSGLPHDAAPEETRLILARIATCLSRHLFVCHLVAAPPGRGIWQRLHGVFQRAILPTPEEPAPQPPIAYREALLLACAQPASFSAEALQFVAHYANAQARYLEILAYAPIDTQGVFWIDLSRDTAAFALARRPPPPDHLVYFFSCQAMAAQARADLAALEQGQSPQALGLPSLAGTPIGKGTLRRLAAFWGKPGKRRFPRRRQSRRASLCAGLTRLWRLLRQPDADAAEALSQWMITNESPDGFALMHLHGKAGRIRVGDIVALRPEATGEAAERWMICLVRWALSENPEHIEIGLQLLAPEATPALLAIPSDPNNRAQTPALILPALPPLRPEPVLVVPSGAVNDPEQRLLLLIEKDNLEIRQVRATGISEQTGTVEVFTIRNDAS